MSAAFKRPFCSIGGYGCFFTLRAHSSDTASQTA